jgi:acyl-coenzyme A thioesterase PaaI-like protein
MGVLTCEAKLVHAGRRIALAEARVAGADGKLIAHGVSTCMVLA